MKLLIGDRLYHNQWNTDENWYLSVIQDLLSTLLQSCQICSASQEITEIIDLSPNRLIQTLKVNPLPAANLEW